MGAGVVLLKSVVQMQVLNCKFMGMSSAYLLNLINAKYFAFLVSEAASQITIG